MKYLIVGLGNIGSEYLGTRHNVGFRVVNALAEDAGVSFTENRYGATAQFRIKNSELVVLKPNTFMNLSGNAVRYWLQKENIPVENLLVVVDDLALPCCMCPTNPCRNGCAATPNTGTPWRCW